MRENPVRVVLADSILSCKRLTAALRPRLLRLHSDRTAEMVNLARSPPRRQGLNWPCSLRARPHPRTGLSRHCVCSAPGQLPTRAVSLRPTKKQQTHGRETTKPVGRQASRGARDHSTRSAAALIENAWLCRPAFFAANLRREDRTARHPSAGSGDRRRVDCNICFSARRVLVLDPGDWSAGRRRHVFRGFASALATALAAAQASRIRKLRRLSVIVIVYSPSHFYEADALRRSKQRLHAPLQLWELTSSGV
jgi:hypothetical protein